MKLAENVAFAKRLAATRLTFGAVKAQPDISRAQFAEMLSISAARYNRYERGEITPPLILIIRIRELTGISLDYLLTGENSGIQDPGRFSGPCQATTAERIRWVRELFEPDIYVVAEIMGVAAQRWLDYETGREQMPPSRMQEFAHRFSVSLDFLAHGLPIGIAWPVLDRLLEAHPGLWQEADKRMDIADDNIVPTVRRSRRAWHRPEPKNRRTDFP
jgi:transcriptional regulator with XRE-family HTH domain